MEERIPREYFAPALPAGHSCNCKLKVVAMDNSSPATKSYNRHPTGRRKKTPIENWSAMGLQRRRYPTRISGLVSSGLLGLGCFVPNQRMELL